MNNEMKKIFGRFMLISVFLMCMTLIAVGSVTAKERSEALAYGTTYEVFAAKGDGEKISLSVNDESYTFDTEIIRNISQYKKYISFTPFGSVVYFIRSAVDLFVK